MSIPYAKVVLFKPSGKYYTEERWIIPNREQVIAAGGSGGDSVGPYCMKYSKNFHRIDGGAVLVETQEPWGFPHLFPAEPSTARASAPPPPAPSRVAEQIDLDSIPAPDKPVGCSDRFAALEKRVAELENQVFRASRLIDILDQGRRGQAQRLEGLEQCSQADQKLILHVSRKIDRLVASISNAADALRGE